VVWGNDDIENDFASRTRNFDCISAGIPIVQNWDDQWGPLIRDYQCGAIAGADDLSATIIAECQDQESLARKSRAISELYAQFSWPSCADRFSQLNSIGKRGLLDRALVLVLGAVLIPPFLLLGAYDFAVVRKKHKLE
jgi:hypothetical protein